MITAGEIAAIGATRPRLVIINGCATFPLLDEKDGVKRNIATAFGIGPGKTPGSGRAYIGFKNVHSGAKGDDFFRIFFYFWTGGTGEKDLTITQAAVKAKEHIEKKVAALGGEKAQVLFLSNAAASVTNDMEIVGDDTLRYSHLTR